MEAIAPRDGTTSHRGDEASTGTAVNTVGEERVLPDERLQRDRDVESDAVVFGAGNITEDTLSLFPMPASRGAHVATEETGRG